MADLDKARQIINETDREMARLFEQRMDAVRQVAEYKREHGIPVEDTAREEHILRNNAAYIQNEDYRSYYTCFLRSAIDLSKDLQYRLLDNNYTAHSSDSNTFPNITIQRGALHRAAEWFHLDRKVLIVTDTGVPEAYAMTVASQCTEAILFVFEQGEPSKNMDTYCGILKTLTENRFTRSDCVVAVGGGVVGDMAGFAAATYMRGIDFYNVPTTLLSQVDSSIGGKTGIDFEGYKNLIGAFYQPKAVLIDPNTLTTLSARHVRCGIAEAIKMAATCDADFFSFLETAPITDDTVDQVITRSLAIKKQVVEADEKESSLRKILNYGHTLGHGIESVAGLFHGECVAIGMVPFCNENDRDRLIKTLERWRLPTQFSGSADAVIQACLHDKKADGDNITVVTVPKIGTFEMITMPFSQFEAKAKEVLDK